jgi:hypothetical protein
MPLGRLIEDGRHATVGIGRNLENMLAEISINTALYIIYN